MKNRIMATLLAFCMVLALLPGTALAAESGTCGPSMNWTLNDAGVLTISGSGEMTERNFSYYYGSKVTTITINSGVNSICNYAFSACSNATRVTIPDTVISIGEMAFRGCRSLPRITIPNSVTSIGRYAFEECLKLTAITIPDSVTSMGVGLFYNCNALTSVTLPDNLSTISSNMFNGCTSLSTLAIPASVTSIGKEAFKNCTMLKELTIPSQVDVLSAGLFSGCGNLVSVAIPAKVDTIASDVFAGCNRLKDIYFGGTRQQWENIYIDGSNDSILSNVTVHYNSSGATQTQYTVVFNANGGSVNVTEKSVMQGSTYGTLPTPTRSGYTFNGWYTASTGGTKITSSTKVNLTADQTLYAQWTKTASTAKTMTVTFNANGGSVSPTKATVTNGQTYGTLPTPTRSGYKFDGWYTLKTGGTKVTSTTKVTKTANHTVYAHWTKVRTFIVNLDANGGTVLTEFLAASSGTRYRSLPTPTRAGYHFNGWYTKASGGTKVTVSTKVSPSVTTLYARWTKTNPTVKERKTASCQIIIPEDYKVLLHSGETAAAAARTAAAQTSDYTVTCTKMVKLSNGTVRYYGIFPKVSKTASYWFTYTDEMFIN